MVDGTNDSLLELLDAAAGQFSERFRKRPALLKANQS
jgi:hypothetical protein